MAKIQCCRPGQPYPHTNQLLNHIVDCVAARKPQTLYTEYPVSLTSYESGFCKITYGAFANAINRVAWWLSDALGPGKDFETLAYIGPNNLVYPALILGAVKAGYKILLLSPRNSRAAQIHLLEVTRCKTLLTPSSRPPAIDTILAYENHGLRILETPTVDDLLQRCQHFPYMKSLEDARLSPLVVMHTSGSTGLPKPITWTQGFPAAYAKQFQLESPPGYYSTDQMYEGNRAFIMFPPFHAAYVAHVLVNAITNQTAFILPLQNAVPSSESLSQTLKHTRVDVAFVVPSIIDELSKSSELLDHISANLDTLIYSGGDVPRACGDIVASRIPIINFYGSTEGASIALVRPQEFQREDWKYLSFHPASGAQFRHYAGDMYELFIVRRVDLENHQQIFDTFPELQEFRTHDLFLKHPTKSALDLWSHCGRADDIVVFSSGEKVNPVDLEQYIFSRNPEVSGVLVAGSQRFQAALLIELVENDQKSLSHRAEIIDKMWTSIEEANQTCPAHARIVRSHILFTLPQRPMSRSSKGTIQRAATLAAYAEELDDLYQAADNVLSSTGAGACIDARDTVAVSSYLKRAILNISGWKMTDDDNFFARGMDSLQALLLVRDMKHNFNEPSLTTSIVYANPSIAELSVALQYGQIGNKATSSLHDLNRRQSIETMIAEYQRLVDQLAPGDHVSTGDRAIIMLTGSTGILGAYLLHDLLASRVDHVYCMNRTVDAHSRQIERCRKLGLTIDFPKDRVTFITTDLSQAKLDLEPESYRTLQSSVTCIVHNAWAVNFNHPLSSFEPQIKGVFNLVKLAASASHSPKILYVSSVSAVSSLPSATVPEEIIQDSLASAEMGYGESKYVAERILGYAARKLSLRIDIARVGQIAGPILSAGEWNMNEWFPSLVRSSLYLGTIPTSLGPSQDRVDWIPIDVLAQIMMELIGLSGEAPEGPSNMRRSRGHISVFNLLNLHPVEWKSLLPKVVATLSSTSVRNGGNPVETDNLNHWLRTSREKMEEQMGAVQSDDKDVELLLKLNPAFKLLTFYEKASMQQAKNWDTRKAESVSAALRGLDGIRGEWVEKWMKSWLASARMD